MSIDFDRGQSLKSGWILKCSNLLMIATSDDRDIGDWILTWLLYSDSLKKLLQPNESHAWDCVLLFCLDIWSSYRLIGGANFIRVDHIASRKNWSKQVVSFQLWKLGNVCLYKRLDCTENILLPPILWMRQMPKRKKQNNLVWAPPSPSFLTVQWLLT